MVSLTANEIQPGPKYDVPTGPCATAGSKQRHILDIVFLQDSTGSQGRYIQACKAAVANICNKVSEHMSSSASPSSENPIRFGLIAFRDHPPQDRSYVTKNFGFTSSVSEMKKWLGGLVASGGGDGPEASTAAMAEALNMEWRQSDEDEDNEDDMVEGVENGEDHAKGEEGVQEKKNKHGTKVVKIVVLVTDAPPHGLGEARDGFPNGSPDQNDPLDIARQMAEHGISLYVIACEPTLSHSYKHAVDFYRALTQITSGRMVPLLNASQLGDYIIGSALETLETEELLAQFQDTILENVYGRGKSIEEVIQGVQQQLAQQQVEMQTLQVDDVYAPSKEADANVHYWMNAGKIGDARASGKIQEIKHPRMKMAYTGGPERGGIGMGGSAFGSFSSVTKSRVRSKRGEKCKLSLMMERGAGDECESLGLEDMVDCKKDLYPESCSVQMPSELGFTPRGKGGAISTPNSMGRSGSSSTSASPIANFSMSPPPSGSTGLGEGKVLPQVQTSRQAVSLEQTRRMVMRGLSRHAKVGPGGELTPKGVWAKAAGPEV